MNVKAIVKLVTEVELEISDRETRPLSEVVVEHLRAGAHPEVSFRKTTHLAIERIQIERKEWVTVGLQDVPGASPPSKP